MKVWMKTQKVTQDSREEVIVAICDENLLGKEFSFFKISEHFFKGKLVDIETAIKELEKATIANLVGKNIINKAIEKGKINKDSVKEIQGVLHAQIFLMS